MYTHLINRWDAMRDSFWFLPTIMCGGALVLALTCTSLDRPLQKWFVHFVPWVAVSTDAARSSLMAIGSAMVSIASIVLSVMLVTLSITSSQYGSRLLRTFMSDRVTQFALGMLMGTSLFTILALTGIRDSSNSMATANVPVIVGLFLAIGSLAVLIGFIDHVAKLIQAPNVVAAVAHDVNESFDRLFPDRSEQGAEVGPSLPVERYDTSSQEVVLSTKEGYLQAIDQPTLLSIAKEHGLFMRILCKPGEFIEQSQPIVEVFPYEIVVGGADVAGGKMTPGFCEQTVKRIDSSFISGPRRTTRQDAECAVEELVEIAVRALSPGINDPFTAIACIDRLSAALGRVSRRRMPDPLCLDEAGVPRIVTRVTTFSDLMDTAFDQIRQHGSKSVAVAIRLAEGLRRIARRASTAEQRRCIARHADVLQRDFRSAVGQPDDAEGFQVVYDEIRATLAVHS